VGISETMDNDYILIPADVVQRGRLIKVVTILPHLSNTHSHILDLAVFKSTRR
jgi:hypothetical protein